MGGASNRAWNIARALSNRGHEVRVVAGFPYYPHGIVARKYRGRFLVKEKLDGIEILRVWIPSLPTTGLLRRLLIYLGFTVSYAFSLFTLLNRKLDLVYYVSPYPLSFFSMPACLFGRLKRAIVLLDVADLWPEVIVEVAGVESGLVRKILEGMARIEAFLAHFVTSITNAISENTNKLGIPREKLVVVELAVDTKFFKPKIGPAFQEKLFEDKFIAEYSGLLGRKYDFSTLIRAAKIVASRINDILFLVRGDGEQKDYVLKSAQHLNNVTVLTKLVSPEEVVDYLNVADVLLCPFKDSSEGAVGIPSKILEYLAVAKPVICSARGETETIVSIHKVGIAVPPEQPAALAEAILRLYFDRELCRSFGRNARALAESHFSLDNTATKIEALCSRGLR
jgi:colanic acid biosynthesis glycosyl transferase WcaI